MECRAYGICLDSQSRGYLGKDRKVSSAAGGNLSRMHKTQETAKESRLNFMYSHLRNRTLAMRHAICFKLSFTGATTVTQEQKELVQTSFDKGVPISDAAAVLFYDQLFAMDPSLRAPSKARWLG